MFDGFTRADIDTGGATIRVQRGGSGPPLLLLHGYPQTHLMWHRVAPRLAEAFTVVVPDLRGYGASSKPPATADHAPYAKRAMARDQVAVMEQLGFARFAVAGHDRGGRVGYRLALDHSGRVSKLAVLDIVPTGEALRRADAAFALGYWHWFFLAAPAPLPETLIGHDPDAFFFQVDRSVFDPEALAAYLASARDPAAIRAICEDYRAAATLDFAHDEADRGAGRRLACPVLALWAGRGPLPGWYDVLGVWRDWADDVRGRAIDAGHFLAEEAPDEVLAELRAFFID